MQCEQKRISAIIDDIDSKKIYLPGVQRKYVWDEDQITRLMDSIMKGYPIGTFLFWRVKEKTVNDKGYSMHEFIKDYNEKDSYRNELTGLHCSVDELNEDDTILTVLDGQHRLTSLYIALKGSISLKSSGENRSNEDALLHKELYFNLLSKKSDDNDDEIVYSFSFMQENEVPEDSDECIWYKVKDIYQYPNFNLLTMFIFSTPWIHNETAIDNIVLLYNQIRRYKIINYFEYPSDSIDDVLHFFNRVNSGSTMLSKTDMYLEG